MASRGEREREEKREETRGEAGLRTLREKSNFDAHLLVLILRLRMDLEAVFIEATCAAIALHCSLGMEIRPSSSLACASLA